VSTVRSEWTKLRTLLSTRITLAIAALMVIGLSALSCFAVASNSSKVGADVKAHPLHVIQADWAFGWLAFMVLGVLMVSNEYSSGLIGATLMSTPKRTRVLVAKVAVFSVTAFVAAEVMSFINFFLGHAVLSAYNFPNVSLSDNNVLRSVIGMGIYTTLLGLIGLGAATLVRHTAGAIAASIGFVLVLPLVLSALPTSWSNPIGEYWPTQAGNRVTELTQGAHTLTAWWGTGDMALFVVVLLVVAGYLLVKRDS
jgi:hypothetical protein